MSITKLSLSANIVKNHILDNLIVMIISKQSITKNQSNVQNTYPGQSQNQRNSYADAKDVQNIKKSHGDNAKRSENVDPADMQLRVKQHQQGIIVGVTSSSSSSSRYNAQNALYDDGSKVGGKERENLNRSLVKQDKESMNDGRRGMAKNDAQSLQSRAGDDVNDARNPMLRSGSDERCVDDVEGVHMANERLLREEGRVGGGPYTQGTMNPVFVDDNDQP